MDQNSIEKICCQFINHQSEPDMAHGIAHIQRVVSNAKSLLVKETADSQIVLAAAWLHDCVVLPKNHPNRSTASSLAAKKAIAFLKETPFPQDKLEAVSHAIEAHSFSAGIPPETIEAKVVQDADRIDALGAIGIARCFSVSGHLNIPFYNSEDPFCKSRDPNDSLWTIDHFYTKLFRLPETLNTGTARCIAGKRVKFMKEFLVQFSEEIQGTSS